LDIFFEPMYATNGADPTAKINHIIEAAKVMK
jgi:hypothetical protein